MTLMAGMPAKLTIQALLQQLGPTRGSRLVNAMRSESEALTEDAARQRLSRSRPPVTRYSRDLLPKREGFYYLQEQRHSEIFYSNFLRDLRETEAVYACAIDALQSRGGVVPEDEFGVISGAPLALKKQVSSTQVASELIKLGMMHEHVSSDLSRDYAADGHALHAPRPLPEVRARRHAEAVILDGLREWLRKNSIGSYNKIAIRGDDHPRMVGQFKWDLTGPCYFHPVVRAHGKNGFVVADVFAGTRLDEHSIRYFIRKVRMYSASSNSGALFPVLMAENFTGKALTAGRAAGLMVTTPANMFGPDVGRALADLVRVLTNASAVAAANPTTLYKLVDKLSVIEGRAGNMRGILFELMAGHLAKRVFDGNIDIGILHTHQTKPRATDLDVVCVTGRNSVHVIECKGKAPGGTISLPEIVEWLRKLPVMQDYVASRSHLCEREQTYEFWTTGKIEPAALQRLQSEKAKRTRRPINWKDGDDIRAIASKHRLNAIREALDQHFLKHPLGPVAAPPRQGAEAPTRTSAKTPVSA